MSFYSVVDFIRENYPEYYGFQTYPVADCVCIRKLADEWGVFSNFAASPLSVEGIPFGSAEELYQLMKFRDPEIIRRIRNGITAAGKRCHQVKKTAKSYEKQHRRPDWGSMFIDALKYALQCKYEQCELFRAELARSQGRFIVEDQSAFPKRQPDAWGVKPSDDGIIFQGPNVLGRLLMELRDVGCLNYTLPTNALDFLSALR